MQFFIFYEITLKGCHLILIEQGSFRTTPHIPNVIHSKFLILLPFFIEVRSTNQLIGFIQQFTSPILLTTYFDMLKAAILIQRDRSVIKKIRI